MAYPILLRGARLEWSAGCRVRATGGAVEEGTGCWVLQWGAGEWGVGQHVLSREVQLVGLFLHSLRRVFRSGGHLLHRTVQYTPHLLNLAIVAADHLDVSITLLLVFTDLVMQHSHL